VLATVLLNVLDGALREALFAYDVDSAGAARAAALRVPPHPLLASRIREPDEFIRLWLTEDPLVPGATGPPGTVRALAAAWERETGGTGRLRMCEAMHIVREVRDPRYVASGELRLADRADRPLLIGWMTEFALEAGVSGADRAEAMVDARMSRGGLLVWHDPGPVSFVGVAPAVGGVARIGPVYTPPEYRRRGYAGTAVAAASRRALDRDARTCMLFTDLANPTSNKIYAEAGYERVGDWEEWAFDA
jgi:predicted GNAT family acetyltransferase